MVAPALSADVSGKWSGKGEMKLPDGTSQPVEAWLELQQEGAKVTGRAASEPERWAPIANGKIEGDKLAFDVTPEDGRVIKVLARVVKDRMEGKADFPGQDGTPLTITFVMTREAK
jgi:hypothetical protein